MTAPAPAAVSPSPGRLLSLDVLRGLTILLMIVVNAPGSWGAVYAPLLHASWHGFTPTDLVFPSFLCLVGVSIALAYGRARATPDGREKARRKIVVRALKIILVGLFLSLWPDFALGEFRFAGVLQRIGIVFAVVALLFLCLRVRSLLVITAAILIGYWGLLTLVPVPRDSVIDAALSSGGVERANGLRVPVQVEERDGRTIRPNLEPGVNLAAWVDRQGLPGRLYEITWDPEGLLSTLPSVATCLIGLLIGTVLIAKTDPRDRVRLLLVAGAGALLAGYLWSGVFPLNKNLWSSSFVLVTAGWTLLAFALATWCVDERRQTRLAWPFLVLGANSIAAYVLAGMLWAVTHRSLFGQSPLVESFMAWSTSTGVTPKLASLVAALLYAAIVFVPIAVLYRKRIFLRL